MSNPISSKAKPAHRRCHEGTLIKRFEDKVYPEPNCGCWLWGGAITTGGYGTIDDGTKNEKAYRVSWRLYRGEIPAEMSVLHRCDNPYCVNPDHLYIGTQSQNMADVVERKRHSRGQRHHGAKLSDEAVIEIRSSEQPRQDLAEKFGVSISLIGLIRNGERRKYV